MADIADARVQAFRDAYARATFEMGRVIVGQDAVIDGVLTCLLAGGHVLLEGSPGLGKTLLVRTLADTLDLPFGRIQFTPDLMPADITGTMLLVEEDGKRQFEFQAGPVFASIVLADEINRATPKTQSALLEAMQEARVTVAGTTRPLPDPFFVLATQNPIEMEGTYPLPEAQMDRFLFKIVVGSPSLQQLSSILDRTTGTGVSHAAKVLDGADVLALRNLARAVPIAPYVRDYAAALALATHPDNGLAPDLVRRFGRFGSSPRGAQALTLAAKVRALIAGRYHVAVEDINAVAIPALRHRVLLNFDAEAEGIQAADVVQQVVDATLSWHKTTLST